MHLNKEPKPKYTFKTFIEGGIAFHYYIAGILIIVSGIELFYKQPDKDGVIAICTLFFAVCVEMGAIVFYGRRYKSVISELKAEIEILDDNHLVNTNKINEEKNGLLDQIAILNKKVKQLGAIKHLNSAFNDLRSGEREDLKTPNEYKFITAFNGFCNTLNTAFSEVTSKRFHVCIKIIIDPGNLGEAQNLNKLKKCKVKTFVREGTDFSARSSYDKSVTPCIIKDNTDFNQIVDTWITKQKPFVCNNLIALKEYSNSRFIDLYGTPKNLYDKAQLDEKEENWVLPYKSCITAAIGYTGKDRKGVKVGMIIGFLIIDSIDKDIFDEDIHPAIVSGCAEGLFNPLYNFLKIYNSHTHVNKKSQQTSK